MFFPQNSLKKREREGGGKGSHTYTLIMLVQAEHGYQEQVEFIRKPIQTCFKHEDSKEKVSPVYKIALRI